MWTELKPITLPLTAATVRRHAALATFGGDRLLATPKARMRTEWLRMKLCEGKFMSPSWAVAELGGIDYRVDGGHSSLMLLGEVEAAEKNRDGLFPEHLTVILRQFVCESKADLADLFMQFDPRKSLRTFADKVRAQKAVDPTLHSTATGVVQQAVSGIAYCLSDCGRKQFLDDDDRTILMHPHARFITWTQQYAAHRHMSRRGVLAAMFSIYSKSSTLATEFFDFVATESHPDVNNPTRWLARILRDSFGRKSHNKEETIKRFGPNALHDKTIHAYNAWRAGVTTVGKFYPNAKTSPRPR